MESVAKGLRGTSSGIALRPTSMRINYLIYSKRGRQGTHERDEYGKNLHHPERHIEQHNFGSSWMNILELEALEGSLPIEPEPLQNEGTKGSDSSSRKGHQEH